MKKVLFTATVVKKHINVFHIPYLKMFKEIGWETSVCARNDFDNAEECIIPYCDKYYDVEFERSPLNRHNFEVYKKLKKLIDTEKYDIIHCHTPVGGVITRLAAIASRKNNGTRVIYTAHGFHFYKGAPLINWLVYYPVEWICSWFTDCLITINAEDFEFAKKHLHAKDCRKVDGVGIDTELIRNTPRDRAALNKELGLPADAVIVLSVGELSVRKNHAAIIRAISKTDNDKLYYIICGDGPERSNLEELANQTGLNERVKFLGFRKDIYSLCKNADIFTLPSLQEGLPVALMEAMAAGLPCVVSRVRGNVDLITEGENGCLCDPCSVEQYSKALRYICSAKNVAETMKENNIKKIQNYDLKNVRSEMEKIYISYM